MKLQVQGHPKLIKDSNTGIVQTTDREAYTTFISTKNIITKERRKNTYQEERLARLEQKLDEVTGQLDTIIQSIGENNA